VSNPRLVAPEPREDDAPDATLRPQYLAEFVGQAQACANLKVFIEAARSRKEALDHVLFVGPPGLGKTTLAQIVSRELGVNFRATSGPVIARAGRAARRASPRGSSAASAISPLLTALPRSTRSRPTRRFVVSRSIRLALTSSTAATSS